MPTIQEILNSDDREAKKALFVFDSKDSDEAVRVKFNLFSRYHFPQYFTSKDAPFHKNLDLSMIQAYRGSIINEKGEHLSSFVDIAFRGAAKTSRTKLFVAFAILNDLDHKRKYIKVLAADGTNSKQITTDIYNMLISCRDLYPNIFIKTEAKREETMSSFTTSTGIKVLADTVGTDQRGALQQEARPDFIIFEDFETRKTLRSATITKAIWDNMEEARTSLSKSGACIYNCNYLSERGNVHRLVQRENSRNRVLIIPIISDAGIITWQDRYTQADIDKMKDDDEDFEGERLCKPSASKDVMFNREKLEAMPIKLPVQVSGSLKIFHKFDPSHRIASGHDVAGGVGLDSSTSVFIDFDTMPARVVATYKDNEIKPDIFGYEIKRQSDLFGGSLVGIERNNHGGTTILVCRQEEVNLFAVHPKNDTGVEQKDALEYGWHTNAATKPKMIFALVKAVDDGLLELSDPDLINECKSYARDDLMDRETDPRLTTRHFDLLIAAAIAWQMKDYAQVQTIDYIEDEEEDEPRFPDIGI